MVIFFDNGVNIGQNGLDATGKCVYTASGLDPSKSALVHRDVLRRQQLFGRERKHGGDRLLSYDDGGNGEPESSGGGKHDDDYGYG